MARNQVTKRFLIRWAYYDESIYFLEEHEMANMKILYASLKELDENERQLLADKYRVEKSQLKGTAPFLNDEHRAKEEGLTLTEYRKKRVAVEDKLRAHIINNMRRFRPEYMKKREEAITWL